MEVILLERINRLGAVGDTVKVKPGFARNFLLPNQKAMRATDANKQVFAAKRAEIEAQNAAGRAEAETRAKGLEGVEVGITRQASDEGKLFGSVTVRDVSDALKAQGHDVPRSDITITGTIKTTGSYPVKVQLHPEVVIDVTVNVLREGADFGA